MDLSPLENQTTGDQGASLTTTPVVLSIAFPWYGKYKGFVVSSRPPRARDTVCDGAAETSRWRLVFETRGGSAGEGDSSLFLTRSEFTPPWGWQTGTLVSHVALWPGELWEMHDLGNTSIPAVAGGR